jgi:hypothetical protein
VILMAMMGAMALTWVGMFVDHSEPGASAASYATILGWGRAVIGELELLPVAPFTSQVYRAGPLLLLGMVGMILLRSSWRRGNRLCSGAVAMAATSAACFTLYCIVPRRVNGAWYFAERFPILWVLFLLAAAAALRPPRGWSVAVGALALCVGGGVILLQWEYVAKIAAEIAPAVNAPTAKSGSIGLIVGGQKALPEGLSFDPYMWSGAHYFRRSQAILANAPWMDLPILMIRPAHPNRWSYLDPDRAWQSMLDGMMDAGAVPDLDFVVREGSPDVLIDGVLTRMGWRNSTVRGEYLRIYAHPR